MTQRPTLQQLNHVKNSNTHLAPPTYRKMTILPPKKIFAYAFKIKQAEWVNLGLSFIYHRGKSLKRILLLLNTHHGFKNVNCEFLDVLQRHTASNLPDKGEAGKGKGRRRRDLLRIHIVLTKYDLVKQNDLARRNEVIGDVDE